MREEVGGTDILLRVCTRTGIDAGRWWRRVPLWLCATSGELVILAVGRRRFCERAAIADCGQTHYNHASGELVIGPAEHLSIPHLRMEPSQALQVIEFLKSQNATTKTQTTC